MPARGRVRPAARLVAALAVLAGLLGTALLPTGVGGSGRTASVAAPSGSVLLPGTATRTFIAAARAAVARAASSTRVAASPVAGPAASTGAGPDLAVLPATPVVAAPVLAVPAPRPPPPGARTALPAGPTGRSPPAPAAP